MTRLLGAAALALAVLCGCAPPAAQEGESQAPAAQPAQPVHGAGVIAALDAKAGAVTLDHEPIDAIGWPAMTMRFSADPSLLEGLAVGDRVSFELQSAEQPRTIVALRKQ